MKKIKIFQLPCLIAFCVVLNGCYVNKPIGKTTSPDYNGRVEVTNAKYHKKTTPLGITFKVGIIGGCAAGGYVLQPIKFSSNNKDEQTSSKKNEIGGIANALFGVLAGYAFNSIVDVAVGNKEFSSINSPQKWINKTKNYKGYTYFEGKNSDFTMCPPLSTEYERKYTIRNMGDYRDFLRIFPNSQFAEQKIDQAIDNFSREELSVLMEEYKGNTKLTEIQKKYIQLSESIEELVFASRKYPNTGLNIEDLANKLVFDYSSALEFNRVFPNSNQIKEVFYKGGESLTLDKFKYYVSNFKTIEPKTLKDFTNKYINSIRTMKECYDFSVANPNVRAEVIEKAFTLIDDNVRNKQSFLSYFPNTRYTSKLEQEIEKSPYIYEKIASLKYNKQSFTLLKKYNINKFTTDNNNNKYYKTSLFIDIDGKTIEIPFTTNTISNDEQCGVSALYYPIDRCLLIFTHDKKESGTNLLDGVSYFYIIDNEKIEKTMAWTNRNQGLFPVFIDPDQLEYDGMKGDNLYHEEPSLWNTSVDLKIDEWIGGVEVFKNLPVKYKEYKEWTNYTMSSFLINGNLFRRLMGNRNNAQLYQDLATYSDIYKKQSKIIVWENQKIRRFGYKPDEIPYAERTIGDIANQIGAMIKPVVCAVVSLDDATGGHLQKVLHEAADYGRNSTTANNNDYEILTSENANIYVEKQKTGSDNINISISEGFFLRAGLDDYNAVSFTNKNGDTKKIKGNELLYNYSAYNNFPVIITISFYNNKEKLVHATIKAYRGVDITIKGE